jgi:ribosomal protein L35AE/L33A
MSEKSAKSKSKETTKTKPKSPKKKTTTKKPKKKTTTKKPKKKTTTKKPKKKTTTKKKKPATKSVKKSKKKRKTQTKVETKPKKPRRLPLEEPVKGVLMNYQRGTVNQRDQYGLIKLEGVTSLSQAAPYIGRSVILHFSPQKTIQGRIVSAHGRNGVLRVRFRRGLAADAIAKEVFVY